MIREVDLSNYQYVFSDKELDNLNKVNYFYGKNGTGKSSLVKAIKEQYSDQYNIYAFQGFDRLIGSDNEINAISLGSENTEITNKLQNINETMESMENDIHPSDNNNENLYGKFDKSKSEYLDYANKLNNDLTNIARKLKKEETTLVGVNYNRKNLKREITGAHELNDQEKKHQWEIYRSKEMDLDGVEPEKLNFFNTRNLSGLLKATNEIIVSSVEPSKVIEDLNNDSRKRSFAQEGMEIHSRSENEYCAFCGNKISKNRWKLLDSYFSSEVDNLKERVVKGIDTINTEKKKYEKGIELHASNYHQVFQDERKNLELKLNNDRKDILIFLDKLLTSLNEKEKDIFTAKPKISAVIPSDLSNDENELKELLSKNKDFNDDLLNEKKRSGELLKKHYIFEELNKCEYEKKKNNLLLKKSIKEDFEKEISEKRKKINALKGQRNELIKLSKNEFEAAKNINKLIGSLGDNSFTLKHYSSKDGRKGLYKIIDRNGLERSTSTLSTGEKNILAFLWFIYSLNDVDNSDSREKVVIFDDPVNSNDDNSQYLIMGEIQNLLSQENKPQIFILTHNNQFYLQIKPNLSRKGRRKSNRVAFRFRRKDKTHISQIGKGLDSDIEPIYQNLWDELQYAYDNSKVEFMWNDMRRILETFGRFNYKDNSPRDIGNNTEGVEDKVLFLALLKSLHVNSHVGYEPDIDLSDRNKDQLLNAFKKVFSSLNADEHFKTYWDE